jgi:putative tryptophan/tyrosine transport system substrate-binding protein
VQLLNEIVPKSAPLALLVNPNNPNAGPDSQAAQEAAVALGRDLHVLTASTEHEIEEAFVALARERIGGLIVGVDDTFVGDRRDQLIALAAREAIPVIYERRDFPVAGGLMSYSTNEEEPFRQCGIYVGRILKGERPAELPVLQATKFAFVVNLKTAAGLGLKIPPSMLAIADEVIE